MPARLRPKSFFKIPPDPARFRALACRGSIGESMAVKRFVFDTPGAELHDGDLVQRCLGGARSAWDDFALRYHEVVVRAVRHTLIRLCRRAPVYDEENIVQVFVDGL